MSATAHVIRLGTPEAALHSYLREHDDGETSWTGDAGLAIAFLTAAAAKRYAARRIGGSWHVAEVDRTGRRRLMIDEEFDSLPERDAGIDRALARRAPESILVPREQGLALAAHRRAVRRATLDERL